MDYRLENLSSDDFEELVNQLCQSVLGMGTVRFSKGKDGGRDGRFEGTAQSYPSAAEPWQGKFIIQAKHTSSHQASCSDSAFFGQQKSLVNTEIEKVKRLCANGEVENYLLFTNRKETSSRDHAVAHIKRETGLQNVDIIGRKTLHSWLAQNDGIARRFKIGWYALPLTLTEFDIKDVITAFGNQMEAIKQIHIITEEALLVNTPKDEKNELNQLSPSYYHNQVAGRSLQYFAQIDDFLQRDDDLANIYYNFAAELSNKIAIKRKSFDQFEDIFAYLYDLIFEENRIALKKDKRLIWVFLHHLYFNCHIGQTK
jgi:hypothetical protein